MPKLSSERMEAISYRVPSQLQRYIESALKSGEYKSKSEILSTALYYYFNDKALNQRIDRRIEEFLDSEEGKEVLKRILLLFISKPST